MEIIKQGNPPKTRKTCDACGCEFEFTYKDTEVYAFGYIVGRKIVCPCCKKDFSLEKEDFDFLKIPCKKL